MTEEKFRRDAEMTKRFRELLSDPVMQQAIVIMKDGRAIMDVPLAAEDRASVRVLSQMAGAEAAIMRFLSLGDPMEPEVPEVSEDWEVPPLTPTQS